MPCILICVLAKHSYTYNKTCGIVFHLFLYLQVSSRLHIFQIFYMLKAMHGTKSAGIFLTLTYHLSQLSMMELLLNCLMLLISLVLKIKCRQLACICLWVYIHVHWPLSTNLCVCSWQVFVSCNFCGKSISYSCSAMPHQGRGFSQYGVSGSPTKSKVTSCPGCRKPLPRCALCLMNMGTPVSNCPGKPHHVDRCLANIYC